MQEDLTDFLEPQAGDRARAICEQVRSMRQELGIRQRQPLPRLWIITERRLLEAWLREIEDECNVKAVTVIRDKVEGAVVLNFKTLGPKLGAKMKVVAAAIRAGQYAIEAGVLKVAGESLTDFSTTHVEARSPDRCFDGMYLTLDTTLTPELIREGDARDFVRSVQEERKRLALGIKDRVSVSGAYPAEWGDWIARQVLADSLSPGPFLVEPASTDCAIMDADVAP